MRSSHAFEVTDAQEATRGALVSKSHCCAAPPPLLGTNALFPVSPAALPSRLVPFYENSLTLILLGGHNPPPHPLSASLRPARPHPATTRAGTRPLLEGNPDTNPPLT